MSSNNLLNINKCGLKEIAIFVLAVFFGATSSISLKIVMEIQALSSNTDNFVSAASTSFQTSLFLTLGMFVGMSFGLVVHGVVLLFRIPFPGYDFNYTEKGAGHSASLTVGNIMAVKNSIALRTYLYLIVPAILDWTSSLLCLMGLQFMNISTYQLIRGSGMIFVSLLKQYVLKQHLYTFQWVGMFWIVINVVMVSSTAVLGSFSAAKGKGSSGIENETITQILWGVWLTVAGTFMAAVQFVMEERMLKTHIPAPLLIGTEGIWGTLLCLFVMRYAPEDGKCNTWSSLVDSPNKRVAFIIYCCSTFFASIFAVILTFVLSSVWRVIIHHYRSITVWVTSLVIFYYFNPAFGEMWTRYSCLQIVGAVILIYGTAIYNAPNYGSILLEGQWWALRINLSAEYAAIRQDQMANVDAHFMYENLAEEYDAIVHEEGAKTVHSFGR